MKSSILRQSSLAFVLRVSGAGAAYISVLLLGRWLAPPDFGLFAATISLMAFSGAIVGQGMPQAMMRFVGEFDAAGDIRLVRATLHAALWRVLGVAVSVSGAGALLGLSFILLREDATRWQSVTWLCFSLLLLPAYVSIELHSAVLRGFDYIITALAPRELYWRLLLIPIGYATANFFGAGLQFGPFLLLSGLALWILALWQGLRTWELFGRPQSPTDVHPEMLRTTRPIWLTDIAAFGFSNLDVIAVVLLSSAETAGFYFAASRTASLVSFTMNAVNSVIGPRLSTAFYANRRKELSGTIRFSALVGFVPAFLVFLIILFFGESLLYLFGDEFIASWPILIILALGQLVNSMVGSCGLLLNMSGQQTLHAKISVLWLLISILIMSVFGPAFREIGIAITMSICVAGHEIMLLYQARRTLNLDTSILSILRRSN